MEYLAFGLLGLGAIFILIGILSTRQGKNTDVSVLTENLRDLLSRSNPPAAFNEKITPEPDKADRISRDIDECKSTTIMPQPKNPENIDDFDGGKGDTEIKKIEALRNVTSIEPLTIQKISIPVFHEVKPDVVAVSEIITEVPPPSQLEVNIPEKKEESIQTHTPVQTEQTEPVKPMKVQNVNEHAVFFKENAVLYIDNSRSNTYESAQIKTRLLNTENIHRIGKGKISFDGFTFAFEDKNMREIYKIEDIDLLNFYPNCITITKKQTGLTSIIFIDSTMRLKAAFDSHRMIHAAQ